jgi:tetratricopeptide (TPR) repeat protein
MPFPHQHHATKISDELLVLGGQLKARTRASLNDANHWLEAVMKRFFNALMGWDFVNLNVEKPNYPAADLGDKDRRIAIQITNQEDANKITETTAKAIKHELHKDFDKLIIFFLLPRKPSLPTKFQQPANGPVIECWDVSDLLQLMPELQDQSRLKAAAAVLANDLGLPGGGDAVYPSNLPGGYTNRLFLGRDDFLDKVRASLQSQTGATAITQSAGASIQTPAATSLAGLGGIGKTHTAIAYADRYRGDYTALLFVSGETPERLRSTLAGLCGVLHLDRQGALPPDEPTRVTAAVEWLASHRDWLLIVDNVDDEAAATELTGLLSQLTTGHVLITSRLHGWADNVEALDLSVLDPDAATDLLRALAKDRRGDKTTDHGPARLLADLLEGLPLAIQQAAGYINEQRLSFDQALAYYQQEATGLLRWFNSLTIPYQAPEQVGPLPVLFTWKSSFDKLAPDTRRWLRVFAHYAPDPIPEWVLESRPEHSDEVKARHRAGLVALAQAEKYCLLTRDPEQPQFKLHRLVQQIIRLSASEEENATALSEGIQLFAESKLGNPGDVRNWPQWNLLQAHGQALCAQAPDIHGPDSLSWLAGNLALLLKSKGLYLRAEPLYRRALVIDETVFGPNHPDVAIRLNNLALILHETNRVVEAEPLFRRALSMDEARFGPDHPRVAIRLNNLARLLQHNNCLPEAEQLYRRALAIDEAANGPQHPQVAIDLSNLASLLHDLNRVAEAEPLMRRSLDIFENNFDKDHPNVAVGMNNLAGLLHGTDCLEEAELLYRRALAINQGSLGNHHPTVAKSLNNLASVLQTTNRIPEAESLIRRALGIDEASWGEDHPDVAIALNNLAHLLWRTNRLAEAEPLMRRALGIDEASFRKDHPNVATRLNNLAQLLQDADRLAEAEPLMRRALAIFTASYGPKHPDTQMAQANLDALLAEMG